MKKLSLILAAALLAATLAACNGKPADPVPAEKTDEQPAPAETAEEPVEETAEEPEETPDDGQNPVMNFIGNYTCGRANIFVEAAGKEDAKITVHWGSSAFETAIWELRGRFDTDTLTVNYTNGVHSNHIYDPETDKETLETVYEDGTGTFTFHEDPLSLTWADNKENAAEDMVFLYENFNLPNPWREVSEEEAKSACTNSFTAPEGAENVTWRLMDGGADEAPLVELTFDLNGKTYTAREKYGAAEDEDITGLYYDWTASEETTIHWTDRDLDAMDHIFIGEGESIANVTWYDIEIGIAYSLTTTAEDLDGFDIRAVADSMENA